MKQSRRRKWRKRLREKYGDNCYYCQRLMTFERGNLLRTPSNFATIEHLIPAYATPDSQKVDQFEWCRLACYQCNNKRAGEEYKSGHEGRVIQLKILQNKLAGKLPDEKRLRIEAHAARLESDIKRHVEKVKGILDNCVPV